MKAKKIISLVLILAMTVFMIIGCSSGSATAGSTTGSSAGTDTSAGGTPATGEDWPTIYRDQPDNLEWKEDVSPITLTMFKNSVISDDWAWGDDHVTQYITERTGVNLEIEFSPDNEGNRLTLLLASGDKLPDLIAGVSPLSTQFREMVDGEYIDALDELINQYCPLMLEVIDPMEYEFGKEDDGHYYLATQQFWSNDAALSKYDTPNGDISVRIDIMKDLGYKDQMSVTTTDELLEALEKFSQVADQYPEVVYPVYVSSDALVGGTFTPMFGEIGFANGTNPLRYDKDAESIHFWFENSTGLEQLKFFNKLHRDGYLTDASFTELYEDVIQTGKFFYGFKANCWEINSTKTALADNVEGAAVVGAYPITASTDVTWLNATGFTSPKYSPGTAITRDCKDPERAIKFLEYMKSEEGCLAVFAGVFGVDWEVAYDADNNNKIYVNPIGEAAAANGDFTKLSQIGVYNYQKSWFANDGLYDCIFYYYTNLDPSMFDLTVSHNMWNSVLEGDHSETLPSYVPIASGTRLAELNGNLADIYKNMIVEIVLSDSDQDFTTLYDQMIENLNAAGKDEFFTLMLQETQDVRATFEAAGATLH